MTNPWLCYSSFDKHPSLNRRGHFSGLIKLLVVENKAEHDCWAVQNDTARIADHEEENTYRAYSTASAAIPVFGEAITGRVG